MSLELLFQAFVLSLGASDGVAVVCAIGGAMIMAVTYYTRKEAIKLSLWNQSTKLLFYYVGLYGLVAWLGSLVLVWRAATDDATLSWTMTGVWTVFLFAVLTAAFFMAELIDRAVYARKN